MKRPLRTSTLIAAIAVALFGCTSIAVATAWVVGLNTGSKGQGHSQTQPPAPSGTPTATCVSTSTQTVKVAWTAVTHATTYTIYDSTTGSSGTYNSLATGVATNPYTTASLAAGTYYFKVAAVVGSSPGWTGVQSTNTTPGRVIATSGTRCQ
jgi:hypothetical protein